MFGITVNLAFLRLQSYLGTTKQLQIMSNPINRILYDCITFTCTGYCVHIILCRLASSLCFVL